MTRQPRDVCFSVGQAPSGKRVKMKKVCVIGLGYVGLPTAILAARSGLKVVGIDSDEQRVKSVNECSTVVEEPEIVEHLHEVCGTSNFHATTSYQQADYFIVAVPVPLTDKKEADIAQLSNVALQIAAVLKKGDTVVIETTVPVGTTQAFADVVAKESGLRQGYDFFVAHSPERVVPGNIFQELKVHNRVIGGINCSSVQKAAEFYKYFVSGDLYLTDAASAEMVKLIESSFRDLNIAFAQQIAAMAKQQGLDPYEIIELASKHPRVSVPQPSCGVGGRSVAVDPHFLIKAFPEQTSLLRIARKINDDQKHEVAAAIKAEVERKTAVGERCTVLVLGLACKANVDDLYDSPACFIAQQLAQDESILLLVCDPYVTKDKLGPLLRDRTVSLFEGFERADIVVALVAHSQFKLIDKRNIAQKTVLDFCGLFFIPRQESIEQEQFFWPASTSVRSEQTVELAKESLTRPIVEEQA